LRCEGSGEDEDDEEPRSWSAAVAASCGGTWVSLIFSLNFFFAAAVFGLDMVKVEKEVASEEREEIEQKGPYPQEDP